MPFDEFFIVASGTIESSLDRSAVSGARRLHLQMGNIATFGGVIKDETPTVIEPDALFVEEWMRGNGIGRRLVRTLVVESRKLGVETIRGHIESQYALDIRASIFGEQALKFFHDYPNRSIEEAPEQYTELPITFSQARASLVLAEESERDLDFREIGFDVEVDISGIDLASPEWNRPI